MPNDANVVCDEEDGRTRALFERVQFIEHLQLDRCIERRGRLIGEQQLRAQDDSEGDGGALCHAAREFERIRCEDAVCIGKSHAAEDLCSALADLWIREVCMCAHGLFQLCADGA